MITWVIRLVLVWLCSGLGLAMQKAPSLEVYFQGFDACLLLYDANQNKMLVEYNPEHCAKPMAPAATVEIALSLMAFDQGLMTQHSLFHWDGQDKGVLLWNHDQTPRSWLQSSVVWVSQTLTLQLGSAKIQRYLHLFQYGTGDLSGTLGKPDLSYAWLESQLKISPYQQLAFIKALALQQLPVSEAAMIDTTSNLWVGKTKTGWTLYGQTGVGLDRDSHRQQAWFVGFMEKGQQIRVLVLNGSDLRSFNGHFNGGDWAKATTDAVLKDMGY